MIDPNELTKVLADLNYEVLWERSRADAHQAAVRALLRAKGAPENALDSTIERGAATFLNIRLNKVEDMSPAAAVFMDKRTPEDFHKIEYDLESDLRKKLGE